MKKEEDDLAATIAMAMPGQAERALPSDPGATPPPPPLVAGRYRIVGLLGRGGMGSVYRAHDTELDENVALKMLSHELVGSPSLIERFRREVKLARRVTHENVARVFDIGEHEGVPFLTMEFIEGESLADLLVRTGRLPVAKTLELARAVCTGLAAAHRAGVIHRDLKPDNIMLSREGRVLITDFGIARDPVASRGGATLGIVVGTPAYMAPEQVEARAEIDARADIYALGAMLFELVTGEVPWQGSSPMAVAAARLYAPPPSASALHREVPAQLSAVIERCMAREPAARYATADEVRDALAGASPTLMEGASPSLPPIARAPAVQSKTVAVLPFRNLGPKDEDYVAEGLTEDLIDTLSMTAGLRVRPRGAVIGYAAESRDPREIGRELGVEVVVEGSLRRTPNLVRLSARLISVEDGFQIWAQRFDRPAADLLVVSDETARAVVEALTLHGVARQRVAPADPVAVDLYLKARALLRKLWPGYVLEAAKLFRKAHELAPGDARILAGYARACSRLWFFGAEGIEQVASEARSVSERALAAAPDDAEVLLSRAAVLLMDSEPRAAAELAERALRVAPESPDALELYGRLLLEAGQPERAIGVLERARALEPSLPSANDDFVRALALIGQYQRVLEELDAPIATELAHSRAVLRLRLALWSPLIAASAASVRVPDEYDPQSAWQVVISIQTLLAGGADSPALTAFRRFVESPGKNARFETMMNQLAAEMLAHFGDIDGARGHLDRAVAAGLIDLAWLDLCPVLAPLRDDPRFLGARAIVAERAKQVLDALGV